MKPFLVVDLVGGYSQLSSELLALHSGFSPGGAQGPYVVAEIKAGSATCKASVLPIVPSLWTQ